MMRPRRASVIAALSLLAWAATAQAKGAWVLWKHSYEVWVDSNKVEHRRDGAWKKVAAIAAKSDCEDRSVNEARAEYDALTGKGIRATLAGTKVGFNQRNTRFTQGYRNFACFPDTVDPRRPKGKGAPRRARHDATEAALGEREITGCDSYLFPGKCAGELDSRGSRLSSPRIEFRHI